MTEGTKPTTKSRSMLLGYLLGHTSGLDTSISGDGLDYMRQAGASAIETQVRALGLSLQLASFAFANLEANATACADAVSERHTSNEALFFVVGLSLALIPIRKQQGLPTKENEERFLEASQRCGIRDIAESLLTTLQRNEEELATAVADAIQLVAARQHAEVQVFLCHAREDKEEVKKIYSWLKSVGHVPWLDDEDLLPGQAWEAEIKKAVGKCHAILVCLSQRCVNKTGFVQKEMRLALEAAELRPRSKIFLIPARLDACDVPEEFSGRQFIDVFKPGWEDRLMKALSATADC